MTDSTRYNDWILKANEDLNSAKILIDNDGANSIIAFHSQQAAEKMLKAFLLYKTNETASGHSLSYLLRQCKKHESSFDEIEDHIYILDDYYIETRYPADAPIDITDKDAKISIESAEIILDFISNMIQ